MSKLLRWLLSYLYIGIVDGDPEADPAADANADPNAEAGDGTADEGDGTEGDGTEGEGEGQGEGEGEGQPPAQSRAQRAITEARRRAQEAETRAATAQRELDEARRQAAPPVDRVFQEEEQRLRDPACTPLERWQIESNRTIRRAEQGAAAAQFAALDTSDRSAYQTAAIDNPRMRSYAERVEARLAEMRKQGQNAPRQAIYRYLLGEDIDKGVVKPGAPAKPKPKPGALPDAARSRPVGAQARSDVNARNLRTSEHEKRRKRLENTII